MLSCMLQILRKSGEEAFKLFVLCSWHHFDSTYTLFSSKSLATCEALPMKATLLIAWSWHPDASTASAMPDICFNAMGSSMRNGMRRNAADKDAAFVSPTADGGNNQ